MKNQTNITNKLDLLINILKVIQVTCNMSLSKLEEVKQDIAAYKQM